MYSTIFGTMAANARSATALNVYGGGLGSGAATTANAGRKTYQQTDRSGSPLKEDQPSCIYTNQNQKSEQLRQRQIGILSHKESSL